MPGAAATKAVSRLVAYMRAAVPGLCLSLTWLPGSVWHQQVPSLDAPVNIRRAAKYR